jgi:tRNA pseudouridine55 synthase
MHGVLVVDKPQGMTSAAVVAAVRRALRVDRIGHTGTLDPMATGVLPLCIGEATKLAGYLLAADKRYDAELTLGVETDTLDADGAVVRRRDAEAATMTRERIAAALAARIGEQQQIPPMHSAIKQGGKRLYQLARAGQTVERAARAVTVYAAELLGFEPPRAQIRVHCSKGTYIRSLAADLGEDLGCGAHLSALRRTASGPFDLEMALPLDEVRPGELGDRLISPPAAVEHLPSVRVAEPDLRRVRDGQRLAWSDLTGRNDEEMGLVALLTPGGALLALAEVEAGRLRYARVFTYGLT